MNSLVPGLPAPDFLLPESGALPPRRLSDLRGRPVLLAFSPPGWDPARAEAFAQIHRVFDQSGFGGELLRLSPTADGTEAAFGGEEEALPVLTAPLSGDAATLYGVSGRQALFVLDAGGVVRWQYAAAPGALPRAEDLRAALASLSAQSPSAQSPSADSGRGLTRREFLAAALGVALVLSVPLATARAAEAAAVEAAAVPAGISALRPPSPVGTLPVTLSVNGTDYALHIEPRVSLLDAVRERIGLSGSKKGCDHGQCGACTMHADGKRINSCLALAVAYQGKKITTVEGLAAPDGTLSPVQAAFIEHDGFQCGFCTSGQLMSASALLTEPVGPEDSDVREAMSGNLCRCGAYNGIVAAVQDARKGNRNASV